MSNSVAFGRSAQHNPINDVATQASSVAGSSFKLRWGVAIFLIVEALPAFAPLAVPGLAIGWPASLRNPAAIQ